MREPHLLSCAADVTRQPDLSALKEDLRLNLHCLALMAYLFKGIPLLCKADASGLELFRFYSGRPKTRIFFANIDALDEGVSTFIEL